MERNLTERDVAQPVRQILGDWSRIEVADFPSTLEGLSGLTQLMFMIAIRNRAFIKAHESVNDSSGAVSIGRFIEEHQALVANLAMIRAEQAGVADVADLVASLRHSENSLQKRRQKIVAKLPQKIQEELINKEMTVTVHSSEIAHEMNQASQLIWASLDEALDADWLNSNLPEQATEESL